MDHQHQLWLEDAATRLLCVLALDRFGDFLSDAVVAPVRETVAQCLGATMSLMTAESVQKVNNLLLQLLHQKEWEARHGGLLGIKYMLAVKEVRFNSVNSVNKKINYYFVGLLGSSLPAATKFFS